MRVISSRFIVIVAKSQFRFYTVREKHRGHTRAALSKLLSPLRFRARSTQSHLPETKMNKCKISMATKWRDNDYSLQLSEIHADESSPAACLSEKVRLRALSIFVRFQIEFATKMIVAANDVHWTAPPPGAAAGDR